MPYPPGHSVQVKTKIVQSARRLFNRHGFDNVSIGQIMAGAASPTAASTAISRARAIYTRKFWDAASPTRNGRVAGKA